ncbi:MAG: hypothetical protein NWE93_03200 [Candidatus Bathyarchaeota archaeon]|nr:hypothetical protein [Candidatus Bathyarchaeota archaeon]
MSDELHSKTIQITDEVFVIESATEPSENETHMGTKFCAIAMSLNILGLAAVSFSGASFSGNVVVADIVLGSSLACLAVSLVRSTFKNVKLGPISKLFSFRSAPATLSSD